MELKLGKPDNSLRMRTTFKVTFHSNMPPSVLLSQWSRVPEEIRNLYPELDRIMKTLEVSYSTYRQALITYQTLKKVYLQTKEVLENVTAGIYNPSLIPALAADKASAIATTVLLNALDKAEGVIIDALVDKTTK